MFTGLVEKVGKIVSAEDRRGQRRVRIKTGWSDLELGESVSVNGVCLTVAEADAKGEALFFVSGQKILHGALHYRDIVDVKPPLIYYLYAAAIALFGDGWISIRIFDLLVQGGTCWLMAALVRRSTRNDLMAAAAPVIYLLLYFGQSYPSAAQAEGYTGLLGLGVAWQMLHGTGRLRNVVVGALCGALFLTLSMSRPRMRKRCTAGLVE